MARKPFPIRLDTTVIEKIDALSKSLGIPKSQIVDDALDQHLDKLKSYEEMDKRTPKQVKADRARIVKALSAPDPALGDVTWKPGPDAPNKLTPGGITYVDGFSDAAVVAGRMKAEAKVRTQPKVKHLKPTDDLRSGLGQTRTVRGYASDGSPIYR